MLRLRLHSLFVLLLCSIWLAACSAGAAAPSTPVPTTAPTQAPSTPVPTTAPTQAPTATTAPAATTAPTPTTEPSPTAEPNPTSDPITGAPAFTRGEIDLRPYAVMLDNHPRAYPQSGLNHASVVFEALAEFGITRFIAIFDPGQVDDVPSIGPVRSTRLYFAQWAMGFHPIYAHAGGSPSGLALVESTDQLINLDALRQDGQAYFTRNGSRPAPHNLYTSSAALAQAAADFNAVENDDDAIGYLFKTNAPEAERPESQTIEYFFIYRDDPAGWRYDRQTNGYLRLRRGTPAVDALTGEQIWTKNVVVMEVFEQRIAGDDKGRIEQQVIGEGRARLFQDGVEREVTWRKDADAAPVRFYTPDGNEVRFNAGPIWIVAVPSLDNLTVGS